VTIQKLSAVCGVSILALAGFGARPASALPNAYPLTRLASPVFKHDKDKGHDRWQGRQNQDNQHRDWNNQHRDWNNRNRDNSNRDQWNRDRDQQNRDQWNRDRDQQNRDQWNRDRDNQ